MCSYTSVCNQLQCAHNHALCVQVPLRQKATGHHERLRTAWADEHIAMMLQLPMPNVTSWGTAAGLAQLTGRVLDSLLTWAMSLVSSRSVKAGKEWLPPQADGRLPVMLVISSSKTVIAGKAPSSLQAAGSVPVRCLQSPLVLPAEGCTRQGRCHKRELVGSVTGRTGGVSGQDVAASKL